MRTLGPTNLNGKVLVVDDEEGLRRVLATQLKLSGFEVVEAADGAQAIEALRGEEYAVVVTDMRMPHADGLAVMHETRRLWPLSQVIILTAYGSLENVLEAVRAGNLFDYLVKPLEDLRELSVAVERAMRERYLVLQNRRLEADLETALGRLEQSAEQLVEAAKRVGIGRLAETVVRDVAVPLEAVHFLSEYSLEKARCLEVASESAETTKEQLLVAIHRLAGAASHSRHVMEALLRYVCADPEDTRPFCVNSVVADALQLLQGQMVRAQLDLHTTLAPDLPEVLANPARIQQALTGLLLEALEHSRPGQALELTTRSEGGKPPSVLIEIGMQNSEGPGSARETQPIEHLEVEAARALVERFGGRLLLAEERDGTRISLRLPAILTRKRPQPAGKVA